MTEELMARALRRIGAGTMVGTKDCDAGSMKARVTPNTASTAKIGNVVEILTAARLSNTTAQTA